MKVTLTLMLSLSLMSCSAAASNKSSFRFVIKDIMSHSHLSDKERFIWLGYSMSLAKCIQQRNASYEEFPMDCETSARTIMIQAYEEEDDDKAKSKRYSGRYEKELLSVYHAGYMDAYVWEYHGQKNWEKPADYLKFKSWSKTNLPEHTPQTHFIGKVEL